MALSDERIWGSDAIMKANAAASLPIPILRMLCHSVEVEARKDDEALIRQMLDALELPGTKNHQMLLQCAAAERAARARLEGKP